MDTNLMLSRYTNQHKSINVYFYLKRMYIINFLSSPQSPSSKCKQKNTMKKPIQFEHKLFDHGIL